jgi:DNA-binding transcriptional LysR family regulator
VIPGDLSFHFRKDTKPMELRHLRYFVAVAEELNFTRAAKRLGINQPPLSLQIRQLENEMGTPLFVRHIRGVQLTNVGMLMLEDARVILKQVEQAKIGVRRRGRGETGRLNIGSSGETYFHPLVPTIIREHRIHYPNVVLFPQASNTACFPKRATQPC